MFFKNGLDCKVQTGKYIFQLMGRRKYIPLYFPGDSFHLMQQDWKVEIADRLTEIRVKENVSIQLHES